MGDIRPYIHQMGDTVAALSFGITLEEFAHLEEQHHKHSLGKLRLGARQEADAERADGGYGHEKMLVEGIAMHHALGSLAQCVVADKEIRNQIEQQQLPRRQLVVLLNPYRSHQQHYCCPNEQQLVLQVVLVVMMLVMMFAGAPFVPMLVVMMIVLVMMLTGATFVLVVMMLVMM